MEREKYQMLLEEMWDIMTKEFEGKDIEVAVKIRLSPVKLTGSRKGVPLMLLAVRHGQSTQWAPASRMLCWK